MGGPNTLQTNSRWRTAAILNRKMLNLNRFNHFDQIRHSEASQHSGPRQPIIFRNLKIQDGGGQHFKTLKKNRYISAIGSQFSQNLAL